GNMFQLLGIAPNYPADRSSPSPVDYGLYQATKEEQDRFVFRVPSLRNVALTAPYFHDGSASTREDAVEGMASGQIGRTLTSEEVSAIVAFLGTLTGQIPEPPS